VLAALSPIPHQGQGNQPCAEDPESVKDPDHCSDVEYAGTIEESDECPMKGPEICSLREFLQSIPIVTDQGSTLEKVIHDLGLTWIICRRHILESIGSSTAIVEQVESLLRTVHEREGQREVEVFSGEMKRRRFEWSPGAKGYDALLTLLGNPAPGSKHHLADTAHLAL
jgi:DNA-directed RNA polymerase subunit N (RpoN/RPB10)